MSRVRLLAWIGVALCGVPLAVTADDAQKVTEVDGTWKLTKYVENGRPNEDVAKGNYQIVRKDGTQAITKDGKPFSKGKYEVDPAKSPKHIDLIDDKGVRVRGVYEIKG